MTAEADDAALIRLFHVHRHFHATRALTDITLETEGITLEDRYPEALSDLWDQKPLVFKAKYLKPGKGTITIKGHRGGEALRPLRPAQGDARWHHLPPAPPGSPRLRR